jgi:hypothetical protein
MRNHVISGSERHAASIIVCAHRRGRWYRGPRDLLCAGAKLARRHTKRCLRIRIDTAPGCCQQSCVRWQPHGFPRRNGVVLYIRSKRRADLFVSTRQSKDAPWNEPVNLAGPIDDPSAGDFSLRLSFDALSLYFASTRAGGLGKADMYVATRKSRRDRWGAAVNLGAPLNTDAFKAFPTPSADGTELYFNRSTTFDSQDSDIWVTTRASREQEWGAPRRLPREISSERAEFSPSLLADGKTLYFASERGGSIDIWVSTRSSTSQEWSSPRRLGPEVNAPGAMTLAPFISSDQQTLDFMSARPDSAATKPCTPQSCFNRVDLYVARARCR